MAHQYKRKRLLNFSETDLAGIAHFSNYFRMMEETEHAFYRSLGLSVHPGKPHVSTERIGWPRLKANCDFRLPIQFEEEIEIELLVAELRNKSIRYVFRFWKEGGKLAATGEIVIVCCQMDTGTGKIRSVDIPTNFREKIDAAPEEMLKLPKE